jgi:hypothetical protein
MLQHTDSLPKIYESLIKMDQFAFTFNMQAQLAADLVGDPDFTGSDIQINNMKMGTLRVFEWYTLLLFIEALS